MQGDEKLASRLGFSASHSREVAYDGEDGEHSPFAKYLIEFLKRQNRPVPIAEVANYVKQKVMNNTDPEQTPVFEPLRMKGHDSGQLYLRPKHSFYRFEDVQKLVLENQLVAAEEELRNFCQESKQLQKGYEYLICSLMNNFNRLKLGTEIARYSTGHRNELSTKINLQIKELISALEKAPPPEATIFEETINLIAKDKIDQAFFKMKEKYQDHAPIHSQLILLNIRFKIIKREWNEGRISSEEFEKLYQACIESFILLLKNIEAHDTKPLNTFYYAQLNAQGLDIISALRLLEDFFINNLGEMEEWYLLETLIKWSQDNRIKSAYDPFNSELDIEKNRIVYAIVYLQKRIEKQDQIQIHDTIQKIRFKEEDYALIKARVERYLWHGRLKELVHDLIDFMEDKTVGQALIEVFEKPLTAFHTGMIEFYSLMSARMKFAYDLITFVYQLNHLEVNRNINKDNEQEKFRKAYKRMSRSEKIAKVRELTAASNILDALEILKSLRSTKEQTSQVKILEVQYLACQEDQIFTNKNRKMIQSRIDEIYFNIRKFLKEIEAQH